MVELSSLLHTPAAARFLQRICDELADRRSVLLLLPEGIDPREVRAALRDGLVFREFAPKDVRVGEQENDHPPSSVGAALGVRWSPPETPRTVFNLARAEGLPEIVMLHDLELAPPEERARWSRFVAEWAHVAHYLADDGHLVPPICLICPATALLPNIPSSDVRLSVQHWWGFPSALEVHVLCRAQHAGGSWDTLTRWREHILPSLAGSDISVVRALWDVLPTLSPRDLECALRAYGEERGWTCEGLITAGADKVMTPYHHEEVGPTPPDSWQALWALGAASWTLEYGLELHSAALALLGRSRELQQRIWRGQADLLLPMVDHLRLHLCQYLSERYERSWPLFLEPESEREAAEVRKDPLACQWGHLSLLLLKAPALTRESRWRPLANTARTLRNEIAHYRPVSYEQFEELWSLAADTMRQTLSHA
jgi:hypothetical protein